MKGFLILKILAIILLIIVSSILLFMGGYLLGHQRKPFLVFHPESTPTLGGVLKICGLILLALGALSLFITIIGQILWALLIVLCAAFFVSILSFIMLTYL
ncbi:hypothetical protein [Ligilactobacillus agilis]|uniref:hypothetical protein n=1 Tax=Ligilactobacillus agilis TaxID=1601 RepID=UPI001472D49A|nr:hypothetical protein [Ligilactobacillus agilis]